MPNFLCGSGYQDIAAKDWGGQEEFSLSLTGVLQTSDPLWDCEKMPQV